MMENENLGSKKMNNKQSNEDTLLNANMINHLDSEMKSEIEIDKNGVSRVVKRARNTNHIDEHETFINKKLSTTTSTASEKIGKKMAENRDNNFDITNKRYPNSSPENHKNPKEEF